MKLSPRLRSIAAGFVAMAALGATGCVSPKPPGGSSVGASQLDRFPVVDRFNAERLGAT
jgi:hypothetical protein